MAFALFTVDQLTRAGEIPQSAGRVGWYVELGSVSYRGKVTAPSDWTVDEVLEALNRFAAPLGRGVAYGRLYSPVALDEQG